MKGDGFWLMLLLCVFAALLLFAIWLGFSDVPPHLSIPDWLRQSAQEPRP
jgi:hypothetical protein